MNLSYASNYFLKINQKWNRDLTVRVKTMKLSEKNMTKIGVLSLGNIILDRILKISMNHTTIT